MRFAKGACTNVPFGERSTHKAIQPLLRAQLARERATATGASEIGGDLPNLAHKGRLRCNLVYHRLFSTSRISFKSSSSCLPLPSESSNGSSGLRGLPPYPSSCSSTHLAPEMPVLASAQSARETMNCRACADETEAWPESAASVSL